MGTLQEVHVEDTWKRDSNLFRLVVSSGGQDPTSGKACEVELVMLGQQLCIGASMRSSWIYQQLITIGTDAQHSVGGFSSLQYSAR